MVALGLNLQYGLMRIMNISHGEFLMLGAYLTWLGYTVLQVNPLVFLPVVALALFALGVAVYWLCFQRITRTAPAVEVIEARSLLVGFGLMFLVQNAAYLAWGADLRGYSFLTGALDIGGARLMTNRLVVFGAGIALAGVAGALLSMVYEISPGMGEPYTITALIVIVLGGLGSAGGCLLGGFLLGLVETFGMHFTSPSLKMLLSYSVFIAVLLARPKGLFAR